MVKKSILFINYWGVEEGLTQATTLPSLNLLDQDPRVDKVVFCTIEREGVCNCLLLIKRYSTYLYILKKEGSI